MKITSAEKIFDGLQLLFLSTRHAQKPFGKILHHELKFKFEFDIIASTKEMKEIRATEMCSSFSRGGQDEEIWKERRSRHRSRTRDCGGRAWLPAL
ncbi:hypothetical protein [uncultured Selenomonas sp.]|uniref:hypothetical protein n=1 Tax=uncultured Selenomonas sp. TaxID=159275 RepID=UPI0025DFAF74|nr:hypothetical protein [uncultured Selenomonas sp.]